MLAVEQPALRLGDAYPAVELSSDQQSTACASALESFSSVQPEENLAGSEGTVGLIFIGLIVIAVTQSPFIRLGFGLDFAVPDLQP